MLNIFSKSKPWMVASLLVATSAFAQTDNRTKVDSKACAPKPACAPCVKVCPCPEPKVCLSPAYNAPAAVNTRCSWDVNVNASFIYWQPTQDNMELGFASLKSATAATDTGLVGNYVNMDFDFKPGFKVGLGFASGHDDWDIQAEYTWFHSKHRKTTNGPDLPGYLFPMTAIGEGEGIDGIANSISQSWRLNMDIIDLNLGRSYYVGTKLTVRPSLGARAAFIRQRDHVTNTNNLVGIGGTAGTEFHRLKSNSWGVGTAAALETNWLLGDGFRIFGNGEADVLFTRYTKANHKATVSTDPTYLQDVKQRNLNTMRTHLNLGSGVAYGTYFDCNNWYLDISAGYEFQVFFDQNMFRDVVTDSVPNGNLYVQGLTLRMDLDF